MVMPLEDKELLQIGGTATTGLLIFLTIGLVAINYLLFTICIILIPLAIISGHESIAM